MDVVRLIVQARRAGLTLTVDGDRLRVQGPRSAEPIALALRDHKLEVIALLSAGEVEVAWRAQLLRDLIPERGAIFPVKLRHTALTNTPQHCTLCGDALTSARASSPWRRCESCTRAMWYVLNLKRECVSMNP